MTNTVIHFQCPECDYLAQNMGPLVGESPQCFNPDCDQVDLKQVSKAVFDKSIAKQEANEAKAREDANAEQDKLAAELLSEGE